MVLQLYTSLRRICHAIHTIIIYTRMHLFSTFALPGYNIIISLVVQMLTQFENKINAGGDHDLT